MNAGTFEQYALDAADKIFMKKNIVVMVGGTGLYIKAFCEGMDAMPVIDKSVREKIIGQYQQDGLVWLQNEVQKHDPQFWKIAEQQNPQRLMRALEVVLQTGQSITSFRKNEKAMRNFKIVKIGLELPREKLYRRINGRVDMMMKEGLYEEVKSLYPFKSLNALQTVGYKEIFDYLDGKVSLEEAVDEIKQNTRHYAKRQMTWFKKETSIEWMDASDKNILQNTLRLI